MANFFPRWSNYTPVKIVVCAVLAGSLVLAAFSYYGVSHNQSGYIGYQPSQPIPYDHELHVGQLGLDCRYCHSFVEDAPHANVPSANTCWNCHQHVKKGSEKLAPLRAAMGVDDDHMPLDGEAGKGVPIEWVRVHKTPDYVFFDHSAHVNRGVSCQSCHGKVNEMKVVRHEKSLSMGWCLDCHRSPEDHLRPLEEVFNLDYDAEEYLKENVVHDREGERITKQKEFGRFLKAHWNVKPKESCATCHR